MPRTRSITRSQIVERAMEQFWRYGYAATSIDDLVRSTGASRAAIYAELGGKEQVFARCLEAYAASVVTPAFARVEAQGAALPDIAAYFEHQIARAEIAGLPGPGCLMANAMTEIAPHDRKSALRVTKHVSRLRSGFANAIRNELPQAARSGHTEARVDAMALALVVFANGLWSVSRVTRDAQELKSSVGVMLHALEAEICSLAS